MGEPRRPGALVISLDFELHWGLRDRYAATDPRAATLLNAREAVLRMLDLFSAHDCRATWATVGLLFARSAEEAAAFAPSLRPAYEDVRLDAYREAVGDSETSDPLHLAPSLVEAIAARPDQEIGTHTFSHYYCAEPGQSVEAFEADLRAAIAIAAARGIETRSIVFPRNQVTSSHLAVLPRYGIRSFRGVQRAWMYRPRPDRSTSHLVRGARLVDQFVPFAGMHLTQWERVLRPDGLTNVPASLFLRPVRSAGDAVDRIRLARISAALSAAARSGRIFHLWWHPHNFAAHLDANVAFLERILGVFALHRDRYGMRSLAMRDVDAAVRNGSIVDA